MGDKYTSKTFNNKSEFVEREFEEVEGGYYDCGFYYTPDGSNYFLFHSYLSQQFWFLLNVIKVSGMKQDITLIEMDMINTADTMIQILFMFMVKDGIKRISATLQI